MMLRAALGLALTATFAAACGPTTSRPTDYRAMTDNYSLTVSSDPVPPFARERTLFKVAVKDKKTGQPITDGEGRIFAQSRDGVRTWDALIPGPEVGTYYGNLRFLTAGDWAVAIQFRRDSTAPLERIDWMQAIRNERAATP
ncbi:MAG TPA: hypothetical protein VJ672_09410 [Gemmatimonadaceae bacterium]|nr:hypothetical protein [Gemmatimonadaceae bacterium]